MKILNAQKVAVDSIFFGDWLNFAAPLLGADRPTTFDGLLDSGAIGVDDVGNVPSRNSLPRSHAALDYFNGNDKKSTLDNLNLALTFHWQL